ncbi:MAG TPA: AAA family ATPase [Marinospirillum sp.]|uniref:AAA family ATPase n=1 Tax=Marinospirillum sp. TaxID=2183934 RepID=UPI002B49C9D4|nr:AAA family ATPase [Marinospirillum sp.]HKM14295.1 AAA family ATPase [Marinospirillum sp.]
MKILSLRLKNLNSLYGEWLIDFTNPEFLANGIFALTGPTGAGKSTLLDAICLALYGATPRLGRITSDNEIMSRQTGECLAEVVFESQAGCFRCTWQQRRANNKSEGKLQNQHHELADAITGKILENKRSLVAKLVEEKTGMDFDRFTRSVLLAQGGFDSFLKADPEKKSSILEQITGTRIYSDISKRVHERTSAELKTLELLKAEISGVERLTTDQEAALNAALATDQQQEELLKQQHTSNQHALDWLNNLEQLHQEINQLNTDEQNLAAQISAFQPQQQRLATAQQATLLASDYATLQALRQQITHETTNLANTQHALPQLETKAAAQQLQVKTAQESLEAAKETQQETAPLLQKVRALDQTLADKKSQRDSAANDYAVNEAQLKHQQAALSQQQQQHQNIEQQLNHANHYLTQAAQDEWLISNLGAVEVQLKSLEQRQQNVFDLHQQLSAAEMALSQANQQVTTQSQHTAAAEQQLTAANQALATGEHHLNTLLKGKLLREYQAEKDNKQQELIYLNRISSLENQRQQLKDGEACPLCGAKEHPFAQGNQPTPNAVEQQIQQLTQLISQAADLEAANKQLEQAQYTAKSQLVNSQNAQQIAFNNQTAAHTKLQEVSQLTQQQQAQLKEHTHQITLQLAPLGIQKISPQQIAKLLTTLKNRLAAWQAHSSQKVLAENQLNSMGSELSRLKGVIETQTAALANRFNQHQTLAADWNKINHERQQLYGNQNPTLVEQQLATAIQQAEQAVNFANANNQQAQQQLATATATFSNTQQRLADLQPSLLSTEQAFLIKAYAAGFANESAFIAARLNQEQLQALSNQAAQLHDAATHIKAQQQDRNQRLTQQTAKQLTTESLVNLDIQQQQLAEQLDTLTSKIYGYQYQLKTSRDNQAKLQEKQHLINQQTLESDKWRQLHELIGSADGKKFRNFAQGLTFELLIAHANRQLEKMTDRYLLINHPEAPLLLNVVDNYQAGEIRSAKNLSGGESFIVSLTLALGLSKMASDKVQVDSLFLDEGFGTLDEEALDTALDTLAGLQEEGKLIGVISHVKALKERIATQIEIVPQHGGRSQLTGPGCRQGTH